MDKHVIPNSGNESGATGNTKQVEPKKVGTFASLGINNFRFLLAGSIFSYAIQWIQQVVLNWLVYDITGSGTVLGSINLVSTLASLIMIPMAGLLIDRLNRRKLMLFNVVWLFTVTGLLGLALVTGHNSIIYLFIFAFLFSLVGTVDMTLRQVLVFDLVPRVLAPNAMALIQTGWSVMRVIGPSVGGLMIVWLGAGGSFLAQSGLYVLIAIMVLLIRFPPRVPESGTSSPVQNIRVGLQFIVENRQTLIFMLIGIVMPLLAIPIFVILPPIYAVKVFGDDTGRILGFLMASVGVGGVLGGMVTASLRRMERWGLIQLASLLFLGGSLIAFALSSSLVLAMVFMALSGFFEIIFLTTNQTMIQLSIPDRLRGRVTAVASLTWMLSPIGNMVAGAGADFVGPVNITVILASLTMVVTVIIYFISPTIRNYRLTQSIAASTVNNITTH